MTEIQKLAHERLLKSLPARTVGDMNHPENWAERDRQLSPEEQQYLREERAA